MIIVRDLLRDLRRDYPTRERIEAATCRHIVRAGRRWSSAHLKIHGHGRAVRSSFDVKVILDTYVRRGDVQIVIGGAVWSPAKVRHTGNAMTDALLAERLLQPGPPLEIDEPCFEVSETGRSLTVARAGLKRIDRATAERMVAELLDRADAMNADPDEFYRVIEIWAYGSYVKGAADLGADLGDVDLIAALRHGGPEAYRARCGEGFEGLAMNARLERRAERRLRGGNRHLSLIWTKPSNMPALAKRLYPRTEENIAP